MPRTDELKRWVGRLMAGEVNTRDLDVLFLWLRGRSFGNRTVADIGDFVAHSDEREKGVAWAGVQHFFNVARFLLPRAGHTNKPPVGALNDLRSAAKSAFELSTPEEVRAATGLSKNKAAKALASALEALASLDGRKLTATRLLSPAETTALTRYTSVLISRAAFIDEELISELLLCLAKNHLIEHVPSTHPRPFRDLVSLYAIEKMHRVRITLMDGVTAQLTGGIFVEDGLERLGVSATAPVSQGEFHLGVSFPIYMTTLNPREWCEPELLPPHPFMGSDWDFGLEIGPNGKLQML